MSILITNFIFTSVLTVCVMRLSCFCFNSHNVPDKMSVSVFLKTMAAS